MDSQLAKRYEDVGALFDTMLPALAKALPKFMDAGRLARVALTAVRRSPKLLQCNTDSLLASLMQSAQLGLEPDGMLGHAALVPFKDECTLIVMWQGYIELAHRSDKVMSVSAVPVFEADHFEYELGLDEKLVHRPTDDDDPGEVTHSYAICRFTNGGRSFVVLNRRDIERHRSFSRQKDGELWTTHYAQAARKTAVRVLSAFIPQSPLLQRAVSMDGENESRMSASDYLSTIDLGAEGNAARAEDARDGDESRSGSLKQRGRASRARRGEEPARAEPEGSGTEEPEQQEVSSMVAGKPKASKKRSSKKAASKKSAADKRAQDLEDEHVVGVGDSETGEGQQAEEEPEEPEEAQGDEGDTAASDEPPKPKSPATDHQLAAIERMVERGIDPDTVAEAIDKLYHAHGPGWLTRKQASELLRVCEDGSVYEMLDAG